MEFSSRNNGWKLGLDVGDTRLLEKIMAVSLRSRTTIYTLPFSSGTSTGHAKTFLITAATTCSRRHFQDYKTIVHGIENISKNQFFSNSART